MLSVENEFVLSTTALCYEALRTLDLRMANIVLDAESGCYDCLPIVVDFVLIES